MTQIAAVTSWTRISNVANASTAPRQTCSFPVTVAVHLVGAELRYDESIPLNTFLRDYSSDQARPF
eukprot:CAMPEP_0197704616 /NCGR_PEP_ID=MMETSP1338-20131121/126030_1 /TAXON_ID=43686 ORGANISM="Pelagodinium beii, Strain RCC1491" /NCGR_SAMPLE_ID=MMETSP1338 /ASSEMBLY_ACC=CAM_ASM_000754 /LENGTH=65 /DNA_ID=CAMNT_0043288519 /DNA_START=51 /DNA_END=248 /DNA_ORIENTATION=-